MRPLRLYINVDHVATIREARGTDEPSPLDAAVACEAHGADGITIHLREDRRHIQDEDARAIVAAVTTVCNLELAGRPEMIDIALALSPYQITLVPERRAEITTEGGLNLSHPDPILRESIARLTAAGQHVALFIDPDLRTIDAARALGVPAIELHTGQYAHRWRHDPTALRELSRAANHASGMGLAVHAGHGLTLANVAPVAAIPEIEELNIGHSIVSRAVSIGIGPAVREMKTLIDKARQ